MIFSELKDGLEFVNSKNGETLIFNHRSYVSVVYGILVHYLRYNENLAKKLLKKSNIYSDNLDFYSALASVHELEYHQAMLIAYGDEYWNKGFNSELPEDFEEWLLKFSQKNNILL